jgi:hypothetical protein
MPTPFNSCFCLVLHRLFSLTHFPSFLKILVHTSTHPRHLPWLSIFGPRVITGLARSPDFRSNCRVIPWSNENIGYLRALAQFTTTKYKLCVYKKANLNDVNEEITFSDFSATTIYSLSTY